MKKLLTITFLLALLAGITSCKKTINIYDGPKQEIKQQGDKSLLTKDYINSHTFTMFDILPTGTNNTIRVWKLLSDDGTIFTITNVDPALFWKYPENSIVDREIVKAVSQ